MQHLLILPSIILFFIISLLSHTVLGSQQVVIIGGGPAPNQSEVSIHLNTEWIIKVINKRNKNLISNIFFTDGNDTGVDVHTQDFESDDYRLLKPLSSVYNMAIENSYSYFSSKVAPNVGTTESNYLSEKLRLIFSNMAKDDELMLIFQGHGNYQRFDTSENTLRLWNNTSLSVTQLETLMSEAPAESTIRFLLPQCFSGAFSKLIYKDAQVDHGVAKGNRCGFLAQNERQGSEGCTVSVNTSDYQDYSSYFFSALDNKGIDGVILKRSADSNNNGAVSLREAHEYALVNAFSVDYSRSTSDDYLEHWQPWYLKWLPDFTEPDNIYAHIASDIVKRFNIQGRGKQLIKDVTDRLKRLELDSKINQNKVIDFQKNISSSQKIIRAELELKWPQLKKPYTSQFKNVMDHDITGINLFIENHSHYSGLLDKQQKVLALKTELLDIRRNIVQMLKILRMRDMARLLSKFQRFAVANEIAEYKKLKQCEDASIF